MIRHQLSVILALATFALAAEPLATLPATRSVTDSAGRRLEGTVLTKDTDSIQFRRTSDGKEFDLPLHKLSAEDQAFIVGLAAAPVRKLRALMIRTTSAEIRTELETRGFEVILDEKLPAYKRTSESKLATLTSDEISDFDLIWTYELRGPTSGPEELRRILETFEGVVVCSTPTPDITRRSFLDEEPPKKGFVRKNYVMTDTNFVFCWLYDIGAHEQIRKQYPENITLAAAKAVESMKKYHR